MLVFETRSAMARTTVEDRLAEYDRHSELRSEAEAIASDMLTEISPDSVADEIEEALLQFDYDDLNGRAGSHSWGYVEPSEAAGELLEEAMEPFVNDMKRH